MLVVSWFIGTVINYSAILYICKYIMTGNKKLNIDFKMVIGVFLIAVTNCILMSNNIIDIRPYILQVALFIILKFLCNQSVVKTLISMVLCTFIIAISELMCVAFFSVININPINYSQTFVGYIVFAGLVSVFAIILIKIPFINKIFLSIIKWYNDNRIISTIIFVILALTILIFVSYNNFISVLPSSFLLFSNLFCIGVFVFIIGFFKEKSTNNKLRNEYQQLMNYVGTYERLLDERNKSQHEFKNQLIIINDMIKTKKAKDYIKQLINIEDQNFEYSWINKLKNFPSGGIKGLIYYKIQKMIENKIEVCIDISDELNNKSVWKNFNNNLKDVSMVIGVYIDNAIEACLEAPKKIIIIDAYLENKKICIGITNTYKEIKIDKIKQEKYTTKGIGHGYGLSLVKDILSENDNIKTKREINGMYYTERIYVKK